MLRDQLKDALKTAMTQRDEATRDAIRLILAALKDKDIDARGKGNADGISNDEILAMLQGMIKQRRESIVMYQEGGRPELADQEQGEIAVIERFLPRQLTEPEIEQAVAEAMGQVGAETIRDMGRVMASLRGTYTGQMDFARAGEIVKRRLAGGGQTTS